jgi:hypothetical protein
MSKTKVKHLFLFDFYLVPTAELLFHLKKDLTGAQKY